VQIGKASGAQIAFFTFAGLLLMAPATKWLVRANDWSPEQAAFIERSLSILAMGAVLVLVPPLRRWCGGMLSASVPEEHRRETWLVALAKPLVAFAAIGSVVLWRWTAEGPAGIAQWVRGRASHEAQLAQALTATGMAMLLTQAVVGPVIEELVFRGLLYKAWEEQWGWFVAMLLSSGVFGAYHGAFWPAFVGGLVYVALYRRTGSLVAPILAHGIYNATLWYPFLGRYLVPAWLEAPGDLDNWMLHLVALFLCAVAIPAYIWMARVPASRPDARP
jgi:membrane protease YdiL (CAAX protease family)